MKRHHLFYGCLLGFLICPFIACSDEPEPKQEDQPTIVPKQTPCTSLVGCEDIERQSFCVGEYCLESASNFILIDPLVFTMGSMPDEPGWQKDEQFRLVGISRPYLIQKTEVTRKQWNQLMPVDPSTHTADDGLPVDGVSWYDALAYCNALSEKEQIEPCYDLSACSGTPGVDYSCSSPPTFRIACAGYRLPTDAEWELAARAGSPGAFHNGLWGIDDNGNAPLLENIGWYAANANNQSHLVATRAPNAFGLFDVQGNLSEWTWDNVGRDDNELLTLDPLGSKSFDGSKTSRGGSFTLPAQSARLGFREARAANSRRADQGFRPVRTFSTVLPKNFDDFGDRDGDGLGWELEVNGWTIVVDDAGYGEDVATALVKTVTSDPDKADTDGDGLSDLEEHLLRLDPRSVDTDGDGLSDLDEVRRWKTNPRSIDTDGDARGPGGDLLPVPAMFDAAELKLDANQQPAPNATSPLMKDTDGDGIDDFSESGLPYVADVPVIRLDKLPNSSIDVFLNATTTQGEAFSRQVGRSISSENTSTKTSSFTASAYAGVFVEVGVEGVLDVGGDGVEVGLNIEETAGVRMGYETNVTFGAETTRQLQYQSKQVEESSQTQSFSYDSGTIRYPLLIVNESDFAYAVKDLIVDVYYYTRDGDRLRPLGSLTPRPGSPDSFVLGPRGSAVAVLENTDIDPDRVRQLFQNGLGLVLRPSYYNIEDARAKGGRDYLEEKMLERCASVELDFGGGDVQQHRVAAHINRDENGEITGVLMRDILQGIGVEMTFTQGVNPYTNETIDILDINGAKPTFADPRTPPPNTDPPYKYSKPPGKRRMLSGWFARVKRRGEDATFLTDNPLNLRLFPGDHVTFFYGSDLDRDGLTNREEELLGTDPSLYDTDGDGLSDYFEVYEGWMVRTARSTGFSSGTRTESYRVFSDPRVADYDRDGWNDRAELLRGGDDHVYVDANMPRVGLGSDPFLADTDGDGISDPQDALQIASIPSSNGALKATSYSLNRPFVFRWSTAYVEYDYWYTTTTSGKQIRIPQWRNNRVQYGFQVELFHELYNGAIAVRPITNFAVLPGSAGDTLKILHGGNAEEFTSLNEPKRTRHDLRLEFTEPGEFEIGLYFEQALRPNALYSQPCIVPISVKVVDLVRDRPSLPSSATDGLDPKLRDRFMTPTRQVLSIESQKVGRAWCTLY